MDESIVNHLSSHGFDIWLANNRGNKYSCTNSKLSSNSKEFWDFSFQEMAEIDLPLFIQTVKEKTGKDKISIVAHSQGGTQLLASLAEFPELQDSVGSLESHYNRRSSRYSVACCFFAALENKLGFTEHSLPIKRNDPAKKAII